MDILYTKLYVQGRIQVVVAEKNDPCNEGRLLDTFVHLKYNIHLSVTVHAKAAKCQCQIKGF